MRVLIDTARCEAHGDCVMAAPDVFDLDEEDNVAVLLMADPPEALREQVRQAADDCPVAAIRLEG
ncbi:ferredoxin [Conexibacter sp. SYSU D00693]|uniref:ferredoxin n=1 Tax=Conexibacter sp. SYSU D00693 TaxID=2812560 RepID=UPI00196B66BF|nr:ferredoxin [Conexibacter sp. SYSU D00693]